MSSETEPVAVVGVSAMFPGSRDADGFWRDILAGRDLLTEVPAKHWLLDDYYDQDPAAPDKIYCRRGGFLPDSPFAPMEFGVPPNIVPATDTSQLLALIVAKRVLEDATQGDLTRLRRDRVAVVLGVASTTELTAHMAGRLQRPVWIRAMRAAGLPEHMVEDLDRRFAACYVPWQESTFPGLLANVVSGRIANQMDLGGTNYVIDAACASSLAALAAGLNELHLRQADLVITGGVDTLNDILMFMCFAKTTALSPTDDCRPFSDRADGTMLGEGLGMFALKRLADAERDRDRIYAVIRGLGSSSDGNAKSIYAPRAEGQAVALRRAYERAAYGPRTVELVEAHGTATKAGDAAEFEALRTVFDDPTGSGRQWCALGSVKSQIGHTKAAAGAASLFKSVMALHHKVLPPTIKVDAPNPDLHLDDSPFYLNTQARPWIRSADHPRRASVSSFGFGGTNFHVTLEEYVPANRPPRIRTLPSELVLLSAPDPAALVARCRDGVSPDVTLRQLARSSQMAFDAAAPARLAIVAADMEAVREKLAAAAAMIAQHPDRAFAAPGGLSYSGGEAPGKVAFLFPGQGSQYVGMGSDLAMHFDAARTLWDRVASMPASGAGLHDVVFPPPVFTDAARRLQDERLTQTEWAQPAIGVMSASLLAVIRSLGIRADCFAGHSFGELTALYAAGVLSEESFVRAARTRGELMAAAPAVPGAMTAVATPRDALYAALTQWDLDVVVANCNSPRQSVLSGPRAAIEAAEQHLKQAGIGARRLNVSTAFHSHLVEDAARSLRTFLDEVEVGPPSAPVFANADANAYPGEADVIRDRLAAQIAAPVLFEGQIQAMYDLGVRTFIELGPGSALSALVDECLEGRDHLSVPLDRRGKHGVTVLFEALGRLAVRGVPMTFDALWEHDAMSDDSEKPAAGFVIPIGGANHGKPYPAVLEQMPALSVPPPSAPAPAPVPAPAAPSLPPVEEQAGWLQAYQQIHQQTVEAQATYQRLMTESHVAFLKSAEHSLEQMAQRAGGRVYAPADAAALPVIAPPVPPPLPAPLPAPPVQSPVLRIETAAAAMPAPPAPAAALPPDIDLKQLLLQVVSEKTGYPVEMLDLSMAMESDLGIDSIKRVQILSAIQDRVPNLPDVETNQLAGLRTLDEVLAYMQRREAGQRADAAGAAAPALPDTAGTPRYAVRAIPAPRTSFAMVGLRAGTIAVTDDGTGVAQALVAQLASRGVRSLVVNAVPDDASGVIVLGGLAPVTTVDAAIAVNRQAFEIAKTVAPRFQQSGGLLVTVQDTGGVRTWAAGVAAMAKTASLEWPKATVKAIEIDRQDRSAGAVAIAIADELCDGGPELEVSLAADGTRTVPICVTADVADARQAIGERDVILASGGARGVTAAALLALAKHTRARFVLLGRTPLTDEPDCYRGIADPAGLKRVALSQARDRGAQVAPKDLDSEVGRIIANREIRATLDAFTAAGAAARYVSVDVRDAAALASALSAVRETWGPITGLVHGAGVLADSLIARKTMAQFDEVFSTKVAGLRALLEATAADPLRSICLFSSVAARYGNPGQCDYAMANGVLNAVAQEEAVRRGPGVQVRSINWGPWDGGMVTPELRQHFEAHGVSLIPVRAGAQRFVEELQSRPAGDVEVVIGAGLTPGLDRDTTMEVVVSADSYPHLASHLIQGVPTLPVVQVLEWFVRFARACAPGYTFTACRNVKVLKGVLLKGFNDNADERFLLRGRRVANGSGLTLRLELNGLDGSRHYEADVEMAPLVPARMNGDGGDGDLRLEQYPWTAAEVYSRERLFHGPDFQVIRSVKGISRSGIAATLSGTEAMGWQGGPWLTDPAAMDGGLQLMLLWSAEYLAQQTLPLGIGEFTRYADAPSDVPLHCVVRTKQSSSLHATFDMVLTLPDEQPVARLSDVQMYVVPRGTA